MSSSQLLIAGYGRIVLLNTNSNEIIFDVSIGDGMMVRDACFGVKGVFVAACTERDGYNHGIYYIDDGTCTRVWGLKAPVEGVEMIDADTDPCRIGFSLEHGRLILGVYSGNK
jgi:hypothetical protein